MSARKKSKPSAVPARKPGGPTFSRTYLEPEMVIAGEHLVGAAFDCCRGGGAFGTFNEIRDVTLERTGTGAYCDLDKVILRNIVVDTLTTREPLPLRSCLFDRVVLRGSIGGIHILWKPMELSDDQNAFAASFYDDVEWALDITGARFGEAIIRGIPVDKVRLDPARHFILRKDKLRADRAWSELGKPLVDRIDFWLSLPGDAELLIACDDSPHGEAQLARYQTLRKAGFAEPGPPAAQGEVSR